MISTEELTNAYFTWATKKIEFNQKDNFIQVKTPFVDIFHDQIEIFVDKKSDRYIVTDDGYTLDELDTLGFTATNTTKKRSEYFKQVLLNFGAELENNELVIYFDNVDQFPSAQNRLVQCMIQVFDMLQTSRSQVASLFVEDISDFFLESNIPFNTDASYTGKTGNPTNFEFIMGRTKRRKECAIKAINNPAPSAYQRPLMGIIDVKDSRPNTKFYILANDTNLTLPSKFTNSFTNYGIPILRWSNRDDWIKEFKLDA